MLLPGAQTRHFFLQDKKGTNLARYSIFEVMGSMETRAVLLPSSDTALFPSTTKKEPTWQEPRYLRRWDQIGSMDDGGDKGDASSDLRHGTFSFHDKKEPTWQETRYFR
jgi:hypothetical protein